MVPLYVWPYPASTYWDDVLQASSVVGSVVLNPNSGAGDGPVEGFQEAVEKCRAARILVVGYVRSHYGRRSLAEIIDEFSKYVDWYSVDGFFIDEVTCGEVPPLSPC